MININGNLNFKINMVKTTTCVQIKLDIETKNKLTELAKKEKRSVANYISVLIDKHLKETK